MSSNENLVLCYNRGCAQNFHPNINTETSCKFHPGKPVFHEGYKYWSCCNKKTTDFTTFLSTPGCTLGFHSNEKPIDTEIPMPVVTQEETPKPRPEYVPKPRPPADSPMQQLAVKIDSGLEPALKNLSIVGLDKSQGDENSSEIKVGTICKNTGCQTEYKGPEILESTCNFHPGSAVFHEGMKYWSCCQRKTSDFSQFIAQVGCETGKHNFKESSDKKVNTDKSKSCRIDWHQTAEEVVISLFAKSCFPEKCTILANEVKLNVSLLFGADKKEFVKEFVLFGQIDLESSHVFFSPNKVEVTLKKGEPVRWSRLELE